MDLFDCVARASIDRLIEALGLNPKNRTEAYERLAVSLRAGSVHLYEALARHDQREAELLHANNDLVDQRRSAMERAEKAEAELKLTKAELQEQRDGASDAA